MKNNNKKSLFDQNLIERKVIRIVINKAIKSNKELEKELYDIKEEWFTNQILQNFIIYSKEQFRKNLPIDIDHFISSVENNSQKSILEFKQIQQIKISSEEGLYKKQLQANYMKMENSKSILNLYSKLTSGEDIDITSEIFKLYQKNFANTIGSEIPELDTNFINILEQEFIDEKMGLGRVKTGIENFDKEYTGFKRGDLVIIGARPSMGKTSLLISIALGAMMSNSTKPTVIFSGEVNVHDLRKKMISVYSFILNNELFIPLETMMQFINYEQYKELIKNINEEFFKKFNKILILIDTIGKDINFVRENLLEIKKQKGDINISFFDYLQILKLPGKNKKHEEISDISREFKTMARELNMPFVVLAQLNRELEKRDDKRPIPSDLKDSGAIEQDADMIIFIYRDDVYASQRASINSNINETIQLQANPISPTELIIAKNRNGKTGTVYLMFHKATTGFFSKAKSPNFNTSIPNLSTLDKAPNVVIQSEIVNKDTLEDITLELKKNVITKNILKQIQ